MEVPTEPAYRAQIAAKVEALHQLESFLDERPVLALRGHFIGEAFGAHITDPAVFAEAVRELVAGARLGDVTKRPGGDGQLLVVERQVAGMRVFVQSSRDETCEWVVTGSETVEVPDPDAPLVTVEREVGEWVCGSLLKAGV